MSKCEVCHNEYDKAFEIKYGSKSYTFDSFECAIYKLAPSCKMCNCKIIGHGIEHDGVFYCCAHCAKRDGFTEAQDRV